MEEITRKKKDLFSMCNKNSLSVYVRDKHSKNKVGMKKQTDCICLKRRLLFNIDQNTSTVFFCINKKKGRIN